MPDFRLDYILWPSAKLLGNVVEKRMLADLLMYSAQRKSFASLKMCTVEVFLVMFTKINRVINGMMMP